MNGHHCQRHYLDKQFLLTTVNVLQLTMLWIDVRRAMTGMVSSGCQHISVIILTITSVPEFYRWCSEKVRFLLASQKLKLLFQKEDKILSSSEETLRGMLYQIKVLNASLKDSNNTLRSWSAY